ncbi:unnamed protein product [Urochloa decumbens]|uniref:Uncharacterized protein n=1 Tax=Urochloa decumbens TaxID=240449 RepID=A0ABC9FAT3_9POAL
MKEMGKIVATTVLVLLLLTLGAEAKLCKKTVKSTFLECRKLSCIEQCVREGYTHGYCPHDWLHPSAPDCVCTKECSDGGEAPPVEDEPSTALTLGARRVGGHT